MSSIRNALAVLSMSATSLAAQQVGPQPDPATQTEVLALREAAWRSWFSHDKAGFERIVPDELVALGWDGGPWQDRSQAVAQMAEFAKSGRTIKSLEFPHNVFQKYSDVVILYTSFRLVLVDRTGKTEAVNGRGTEIFVRRNGRWIHTGWHLDTVTS